MNIVQYRPKSNMRVLNYTPAPAAVGGFGIPSPAQLQNLLWSGNTPQTWMDERALRVIAWLALLAAAILAVVMSPWWLLLVGGAAMVAFL